MIVPAAEICFRRRFGRRELCDVAACEPKDIISVTLRICSIIGAWAVGLLVLGIYHGSMGGQLGPLAPFVWWAVFCLVAVGTVAYLGLEWRRRDVCRRIGSRRER